MARTTNVMLFMTLCSSFVRPRTPLALWSLILLIVACSGPAAHKPPGSTAARASAPPAVVRSSQTAKAAVARDTRDANARFDAALQLMKQQQVAEAQAAFQSLANDYPEFSGPLTALGILYAQGRKRDTALASFAKAVAANPANAVAWTWLGSLYREARNHTGAEDAYRRAIAARSDYAAAHLNLGILYDVSLHRPQDALREYREYQRLSGDRNLMVAVWIKELEASSTQRTAAAGVAADGITP